MNPEAQTIPPHAVDPWTLDMASNGPIEQLVDWMRENDFRLSQVQGFNYGADHLLLTIRDCWLADNQVIWQKQSSPDRTDADCEEMMRAIEIYRMKLALSAIGRGLSVMESGCPDHGVKETENHG